jgi:hypothetical protein
MTASWRGKTWCDRFVIDRYRVTRNSISIVSSFSVVEMPSA